MKLKVPPGEIVPLPKAPLSLVTVCGAPVLFFHTTVVPTVIFSVCGLNAKVPLVIIATFTVVGGGGGVGVGVGGFGVGDGFGFGVGTGVARVGIGVGVVLAGVGVGFVLVGVGLG